MSGVSDDSEPILAPSLESDTESLSSAFTGDNSEETRHIPSKRKLNTNNFGEPQLKKNPRLTDYHPGYHSLYNDTVDEINCPVKADARFKWDSSHIGLNYWSSCEKEAFFVALDRKGQDDIKGISSIVGTKSESEVRTFILALQDGLAEEGQTARPLSKFPSAFEVGLQCDLALDAASTELSQRQLKIEEATEKRRHGEWWLLDYDTATTLEDLLGKDQLPESYKNIEAAATLFDVPLMINLSSQFFMNSNDPEGNWRTWSKDESGPGLYGTSLADFYNLVVGITKRLVSSSIFLAESRNHLEHESSSKTIGCTVKSRDVLAACEILGLKRNRRASWIGIARRCNLDVYEKPVPPRTKRRPLSYGKVEQYLATDGRLHFPTTRGHFSSVNDSKAANVGGISVKHDRQHIAKEVEDEHAELLDAVASKEEELRLWKTIDEDGPTLAAVKNGEGMNLPRASQDQDWVVKDWRRTIRYKSPWQLMNGAPSEELFTEGVAMQSKCHGNKAGSSLDDDTVPVLSDDEETSLSDVDSLALGVSPNELSRT